MSAVLHAASSTRVHLFPFDADKNLASLWLTSKLETWPQLIVTAAVARNPATITRPCAQSVEREAEAGQLQWSRPLRTQDVPTSQPHTDFGQSPAAWDPASQLGRTLDSALPV